MNLFITTWSALGTNRHLITLTINHIEYVFFWCYNCKNNVKSLNHNRVFTFWNFTYKLIIMIIYQSLVYLIIFVYLKQTISNIYILMFIAKIGLKIFILNWSLNDCGKTLKIWSQDVLIAHICIEPKILGFCSFQNDSMDF